MISKESLFLQYQLSKNRHATPGAVFIVWYETKQMFAEFS